MRFLYWIDNHARLYGLISVLLAATAFFFSANQVSRTATFRRDMHLGEKLVDYSATLESGTVNSRAMGAAVLFGMQNRDAQLAVQGKLAPGAARVTAALKELCAKFLVNDALLLDRHGKVIATSNGTDGYRIGADWSFRPYVKRALAGTASVYPSATHLEQDRGIFLAAPVRGGTGGADARPAGVVVLKIDADRVDRLLKTWIGGPALVLSPQGVVFAASRSDWLFDTAGSMDDYSVKQLAATRQFGDDFGATPPPVLPFPPFARRVTLDGVRYVARSRALDWNDPAGDWELVMLDRRRLWWHQWEMMGSGALSGLLVALLLFWLGAMARNATMQHAIHRDLAVAAATFESEEGIMITDAEGVIVRVNRAFSAITGYESAEAVGEKPSFLASGRHNAEFYARMWRQIMTEKSWSGEIWNRRKNGEIYPEQLNITPVFDENGKVASYVGIFTDITQRKEAEREIMELAYFDPLTKLPNRRLLNERLEQAMAASKRDGSYAALLFMDMDKFKQLNDSHGHGVGDELLVEVARRLSACVREVDTVARFGGDEFVVMLNELDPDREKSAALAGAVAEKIQAALAQPCQLALREPDRGPATLEYRCTSSIGVVLFSGHRASAEEILKWADIAMYSAKSDGRNRIRFHGRPA